MQKCHPKEKKLKNIKTNRKEINRKEINRKGSHTTIAFVPAAVTLIKIAKFVR